MDNTLLAARAANDQAARLSFPASLISNAWVADSAAGETYLRRATGKPDRILLYLHTWNGDQSQAASIPELQAVDNALVIAPDFRGPNRTPYSTAHPVAIDAIATVVAEAKMKSGLQRVYLLTASGGSLAAFGLMAAYPDLIHRASVWVPIYDLARWYYQVEGQETFQADMQAAIGRAPSHADDPLYIARSSRGFIPQIKGSTAVFVNGGVHDTTTPVEHARDCVIALMGALPVWQIRHVEWAMGHELRAAEGLKQLFLE